MFRIFAIFFFLFCNAMLLNAHSIGDTLTIRCNKDSYWNSNPKHAHKELVEIIHLENNKYKRNHYQFIKNTKNDDSTKKRITKYDTLFKSDIIKLDSNFIQDIRQEMEIESKVFTSQEFIKIVGNIKRKHVRAAIKKPTIRGNFRLTFDGDDIKEIQSFVYLNEYISYLKNSGKHYTTDVSNSLFITIENASNYITIHQDFLYNSGQPMNVYYKNTNTSIFGLVNPLLNIKLAKIVPRKSYLKNYTIINNLRDNYIIWYLEHGYKLRLNELINNLKQKEH
jgi:hypothetical protein